MRVIELERIRNDHYCEISAVFVCDQRRREPFRCWLRFPSQCDEDISYAADAFLALALLPAMALGEPLHIGGEVSADLLTSTKTMQDIYRRWVPGSEVIEVSAASVRENRAYPVGAKAGCFFSGGVDSFCSLYKHRNELTHLLLISGFDKSLSNENILERTRAAVADVARATSKECFEVNTNIRQFSDALVDWGMYHGAVLGAVALALARGFRIVMVPSSYPYDQLHPWGSHPLLDPLWSTPGVEVVHDGCETGRYEKLARLSQWAVALDHLRVCWVANEKNEYNCGKCEKCLRTMLGLYLHGVLAKCKTFDPSHLTPRALRAVRIKSEGQRAFARENLRELATRTSKHDRALYKALRCAVRRSTLKRALKALRRR